MSKEVCKICWGENCKGFHPMDVSLNDCAHYGCECHKRGWEEDYRKSSVHAADAFNGAEVISLGKAIFLTSRLLTSQKDSIIEALEGIKKPYKPHTCDHNHPENCNETSFNDGHNTALDKAITTVREKV